MSPADTPEPVSAFIVDDEESSRNNLRGIIEQFCPELQVVGEADLPSKALKAIHELKPDLVFLDIEMPEINGLELARSIEQEGCLIVFVTAHDGYAVEAFKRNAIDYVLKPPTISGLRDTVQRALKRRSEEQSVRSALMEQAVGEIHGHVQTDKIALPASQGFIVKSIKDIVRIESDNSYSTVYTTSDKIIVSKGIGDFEKLLDDKVFVRVHNSHIVNLNYLEAFENLDGGTVIMKGGASIPVSKRRLNKFKDTIKDHYQHF